MGSMHEAEHDLEVIIYAAYGPNHTLHIISGE